MASLKRWNCLFVCLHQYSRPKCLLLVLGHCSVFSCRLREFFFIDTELTWHEAREYCRRNHSNLLTLYDMEDLEIFQDSNTQKKDAWTGLHKSSEAKWQWSQPGVNDTDVKWANTNDGAQTEHCAAIISGALHDLSCSRKHHFLCYNGKKTWQMNTYSLQYSPVAHAIGPGE